MALIIALNALFALGVIVAVISPLVWAIFTQHCDHVAIATTTAAPTHARPQHTRTRRHAGIAVARATQASNA
jgi:hypothetical protein